MYVYNELSSVQMSTYNQQNSFRGMVYETVDRKLRVDSNDVGNSVLRSIFFSSFFYLESYLRYIYALFGIDNEIYSRNSKTDPST